MSIPAARTHKMLLTLLAVALTVLAFVPLTAQADEVDDLLSVGSYIEGQAVVGFLSWCHSVFGCGQRRSSLWLLCTFSSGGPHADCRMRPWRYHL